MFSAELIFVGLFLWRNKGSVVRNDGDEDDEIEILKM